jgi:hypothetical protein
VKEHGRGVIEVISRHLRGGTEDIGVMNYAIERVGSTGNISDFYSGDA